MGDDPTEKATLADMGKGYGVIFGVVQSQSNPEVNAVRVVYVHSSVSADIHVGDEITGVNDGDVVAYLSSLKYRTRWIEIIPATNAAIAAAQARMMSRAPQSGGTLKLKIAASGGKPSRDVTLTAMSEMVTWTGTAPYTMKPLPPSCVSHRIIAASGGFAKQGYLQVGSFEGCKGLAAAVKAAVVDFKRHKVEAVIVDLRGNGGGDDSAVPGMMQYFYSTSYQYEQTALKPAAAAASDEDDLGRADGYQI